MKRRLMPHKKQAAVGGAAVLASALLVAALTESWVTMSLAVAGLAVGLTATLVELSRTRAALRGLRQRVERTDKRAMKLAAREKVFARKLREVEQKQANLRNSYKRIEQAEVNLRSAYNRMATSLYDAFRQTNGPFAVEMEVSLVIPAARRLVKRGDALDAHALLVANNSLHRLDENTLRTLRGDLKKRGYLNKSLEVARVLTAMSDDERDWDARRHIDGEIAVLSGQFKPAVRQEDAGVEPRMDRVLHFVGTSLPKKQTGYTLRTHYSALAQQKAGLEPHIATQTGFGNDGDDYVREDVDGITYHYIPGPARNTEPLNIWMRTNVQRLANLVRVIRPVIIHAASDYLNALAATVVGKEFEIPVIYESRGFWEETWLSRQAQTYGWDDLDRLQATYGLPDVYIWRREIEDRCRREVDHVVTLDDVMAERIEAGDVPSERITVVPNAVDVERFPVLERNHELAAKLGFDENTTVIGYISSIVEYEGIDTLIEAYASVKASTDMPVGLLIVGDGPVLKELKKQSGELGLTDVVFTGRVSHDEVLDYYSVIDIFVVPRRPVDVCHLVTPLKPFEAFSTGRTVVLSDVRALANIAKASAAAELFTAGSSKSLALLLADLVRDPGRCTELAVAGAGWVRASRTWGSNADTYLSLYERLGAVSLGQYTVPRLDIDQLDLDSLIHAIKSHELRPFEVLSSADEGTDADEIMEQGWKFGSFPPVKLDAPIDWAELCVSDRSWNFRLHSWDFMGPALSAYERTGEARYLSWCVNLAVSWAEEFSGGAARGTMAWYDMALGLRGHRLGFLVEQALSYEVEPAASTSLLKCVVDHQKELFDRRAFSAHSNHGAYVALGQLALARRLRDMPGMDALEAQGRERVEAIIRRQFGADGGHLEHSPEYHRMVLATVRGAIAADLLVTDGEIQRRLERAEDALGWFIQPNGELAQVGDSIARPMRSKRPRTASRTTEYLVSNGLRGEPDSRSLFTLPETGYAIVRSPSTKKATDQERSSYLILAASFHSRTHKHADDLTISWFDRGNEILIDAGRYGYVDPLPKDSPLRAEGFYYGAPERRYVESTRAHNTVEADSRDYERRTRKPYGSAIHRADEQNGYYCLQAIVDHGNWVHNRTMILYPGEWLLVRDSVQSWDGQPHEFRVWWNFPGELHVAATCRSTLEVTGAKLDSRLFVKDLSDSHLIEPVRGERQPLRGWRSKHDLELMPAWSTGFEASAKNEHCFQTLFAFGRSAPESVPDQPFVLGMSGSQLREW